MSPENLSAADRLALQRLHPDLLAAVDDSDNIMVHHPLMIISLYNPIDADQINRLNASYTKIKKIAEEAKVQRRFDEYLLLTKRPYRLHVFIDELMPTLKDPQYWKLLSNIWQDTEYPHVNYSSWLALFASKREYRPLLMDKAERAALAAMTDTLTIYRGGPTKKGLSWTLNEEKARWFADRFNDGNKNTVFKGTVQKSKVFAYLNGREEDEIVVDPRHVRLLK